LTSTEEFHNYFAAHRSEFHQRAGGKEHLMKAMAKKGFAIKNSQWNSYWRGKVAGGLTMALSMSQPTYTTGEILNPIGLGFNGMDLSQLHFAVAAVIDGGPVTQEEQREITTIVDEVVYDLRRRGPSWAKNAAVLIVRFPDVESFIRSLQGDKNLIRTEQFPTRQRDTFEYRNDIYTMGFAWETTESAGRGETNLLRVSYEEALRLDEKPDPKMLFHMADSGDTVGVRRLIDAKCSIPEAITIADGFNALHATAYQGFADTAQLLLETMQHDPKYKDQAMHDGITATYLAASHGKIEALRTLIRFRVDVDKPSLQGFTPLSIAIQRNNSMAVEVLLEGKCDVEKHADHAPANLCVASHAGHEEIVRLLIKAKAQLSTLWRGKTPLDLAHQQGHQAVVSLLQEGETFDAAGPTWCSGWFCNAN